MNLTLHRKSIDVTPADRDYIGRSLGYALGGFAGRIRRVVLHLEDMNGPRGGVDKRASVMVELEPSGRVVVEGTDSELTSLIDRTADRLARAVQRELTRRRPRYGLRPWLARAASLA